MNFGRSEHETEIGISLEPGTSGFPNPEVPVFGPKIGDSQAKAMAGAWRHGGGGVPASEARYGGKGRAGRVQQG